MARHRRPITARNKPKHDAPTLARCDDADEHEFGVCALHNPVTYSVGMALHRSDTDANGFHPGMFS